MPEFFSKVLPTSSLYNILTTKTEHKTKTSLSGLEGNAIRLKQPVNRHLVTPCCHLPVNPWWKELVHPGSAALTPAISVHTHVAKWMEISTTLCPRQLSSIAQTLQPTAMRHLLLWICTFQINSKTWIYCSIKHSIKKYIGPPYCWANMYAGSITCCPLVSHSKFAVGKHWLRFYMPLDTK